MTDTSRRSLAGQPRNAPPARGLTRRELVAAGAVGAAPLLFGGSLARAATARRTAPPTLGSLVVSDAELAQVRANIFELRLPFAQRAWSNTLNRANGQLGYKPNPTRDDVKITDWFNQLYRPGLHDGNAAYVLAMAWAIQGSVEHARRARDICLAWARTYRSSRPQSEVFHMVAEPVGPVIKLCMAFDLTRAVFSPAERDEFRGLGAASSSRRGCATPIGRGTTPGGPTASLRQRPHEPGRVQQLRDVAARDGGVGGCGGEPGRAEPSSLEWNLRHTDRRRASTTAGTTSSKAS